MLNKERKIKCIFTSVFLFAHGLLIYLLTKFYNLESEPMNTNMPTAGKKIENYVFNYCDFLGNGNFSKCYKARNTKTNEEVAIKIVELNSIKSQKLQQLLFSEIEVLKQMNHPNVLRCHEVFTSNRNCYIITQLCNEGDLQNKIKKKQVLDEVEINNIIADVYKGLKYLASKDIIHRDLKIANIFVHNGVAKIADFGFALHSKCNFRDLNIGSPLYMSPQGILNNVYGPKTDVWAFGIMLYELYHGRTPYNYCQTEEDLRSSVQKQLQWNQLRNDLPNDVKELILNCLQVRDDKRPNTYQLSNNPFLHRIVHNRDVQTNTELKFKSPMKHKDSKIFQIQDDPMRGRSHMKIRSAFSTQEQSLFTNRPIQRAISPNKTFVSHTQNGMNSVNNSFNYHSTQNFFDSTQSTNANMPSIAFNLPVPKIKQSVTMNDNSMQNLVTIKSPVSFTDETLNKTHPNIKIAKQGCIITSQINFKECVSVLHYCRLIFKYLTCFKELTALSDQSCKEHYAVLAQFLIFCLDEVFDFVNNKKIRYEGENPEIREKKLYEVTEEYRNKYSKELDADTVRRSLSEKQKAELSLSTVLLIAATQSSLWLSEKSSLQQIIAGELLLVIYSSTLLLQECSSKKSYAQFQKYKEIEETLNKSKDAFTFANYAKHKSRIFSNKHISSR